MINRSTRVAPSDTLTLFKSVLTQGDRLKTTANRLANLSRPIVINERRAQA